MAQKGHIMAQKGHIMAQKGLKMHEKKQKIEFSNLKYLLFSGMFLSGIWGYQYSNIPDTFSRGKTSSTFGEVFLNLDKFHLKKV